MIENYFDFYNEKFLNKLYRKEYQRIFNNIKLFNLNSLNTILVIKLTLNANIYKLPEQKDLLLMKLFKILLLS